MLHKKQYKKIIAIVFMLLVVFSFTNSTHAEINEGYYNINVNGLEVVDSSLGDKIAGSSLLNVVGMLIYSVGSLGEWVVGKMYELIAGKSIYPWADAIVFNAIPLLDVNFISPTKLGGGSFLNIIWKTLSNVYSTIFGIALAFFTIAVMVMAIKMVISTIASEKAKYKQAIVQWAIGLLLLFLIHYVMSFVFYLNEQLVEIASEIATENVEAANKQIVKLTDSAEYNKSLIKKFIDLMNTDSVNWWEVVVAVLAAVVLIIAVVVLTVGTAEIGTLIAAGIAAVVSAGFLAVGAAYQMTVAIMNTVEEVYISTVEDLSFADGAKYMYDNSDLARILLQAPAYRSYRLGSAAPEDDTWQIWTNKDRVYVMRVAVDIKFLVENVSIPLESSDGGEASIKYVDALKAYVDACEMLPVEQRDENYDESKIAYYKVLYSAYEEAVLKKASEINLLTNLAAYFKKTAWTTSSTGWIATKSVVQNALMYAVLAVQSLILFIAYIKRLFYVTILAMMAPIVVVIDFFNKS